ncbi:MAG: type II secretion system F family protein, partial [Anaerolineales bacterium]
VVSELPAPASEEFDRVKREIQLGLPLGQALLNLSTRMESDDLHMVVTAVIINNQVGGNLSTMLTAVTETIRARIQLFGEVRALTSYARYTSTFLTLLPLITALIIYFINPTYFDKAFTSPITQTIFAVAGINVILGNIWLRRIARVRV